MQAVGGQYEALLDALDALFCDTLSFFKDGYDDFVDADTKAKLIWNEPAPGSAGPGGFASAGGK
jgi:hypothetical protein